jgi:hypothetical protein
MKLDNIKKVLKQGAQFLEDNLVDGIINEGLMKRGTLARSVQVIYRDDQNQPSYTIKMEDYGFYQDSGVSGTKRAQPTNPESLYSPGQFRSVIIGGDLPFAVRKSIAQKGFRPRPFIIPAVNRTIGLLEKPLTEAGSEDIDIEINELFTKNGAIVR